jgi:hypothetical protein
LDITSHIIVALSGSHCFNGYILNRKNSSQTFWIQHRQTNIRSARMSTYKTCHRLAWEYLRKGIFNFDIVVCSLKIIVKLIYSRLIMVKLCINIVNSQYILQGPTQRFWVVEANARRKTTTMNKWKILNSTYDQCILQWIYQLTILTKTKKTEIWDIRVTRNSVVGSVMWIEFLIV